MECYEELYALPYMSSWLNMCMVDNLLLYDKCDLLDVNTDVSWNKAFHTQEEVYHKGWVGPKLPHHSGTSAH